MLAGADKDVFSVEPQSATSQSTVQIVVKRPQELDFEVKQQMVLQVRRVEVLDQTLACAQRPMLQ